MNTATHVVWASASLTPMCTSRKTIEATAVIRCTACARMRLRVSSRTRSCATRPQITEQVRHTRDSTPAPKLRKSANESSAVES